MKVDVGVGFARAESLRANARLAYVENGNVVVEDLATKRLRRHAVVTGPACPLAFDVDGRTLFHSGDQLVAIDFVRGRSRALTKFGPAARRGIIWDLHVAPDGRRVLFTRARPRPMRVARLDRASGVVRNVCTMAGVWRFAPHWPSGSLFVAIAHPVPALWQMDLDGKNARRLALTPVPYDLQVAPDGAFLVYSTAESPTRQFVVRRDLATGVTTSFAGTAPALSPDG